MDMEQIMETDNESSSNGASTEKCCSGKGGEHGHRRCRRRGWIGAALVVGAIVSLVAFNAHSGQSGTGSMCSSWHGPHGLFAAKDSTQQAEFVVDRLMSELKADDAQKLKARAIADAAAGDLKELAIQHRETHQELAAILAAPTLDRAKLEALRSKTASSLDQSSKRITVAVADLADVLTPAQRLQLVEKMEKHHALLATE